MCSDSVGLLLKPWDHDIYNAIMFKKYPKHRKAIAKLHQAMLSQYVIQGGLLYIYI